jgi:hypothetical protein
MVKIAMYKHDNGSLLVIWRARNGKLMPNGKLIGELYRSGEYHRGKWDSRITSTDDGDETEHRIKEYFGFSTSNSIAYWKRWA